MAQPSQEDILAPFDPTAYTTITAAQLYQLISGATPYTDKGMIVMTVDVAGHGQPPNAVTTPKWQNFIWLRISVTSATVYLWNPNAAPYVDPNTGDNFQQWYPIAVSSIPAGGILGYMVANLTITDANISNVNWSKIVGAPTWVLVGGAAGGALSGVYPNPSIANSAVTGVMIANNTVGHLNLVTQTGDDTQAVIPNANTTNAPVNVGNNLVVPTGATTNDVLAVNATTKGFTTQTLSTLFTILGLANPTGGVSNNFIQVNNGGTGFVYQTVAQVYASINQSAATSFTSTGITMPAGMGVSATQAHGLGARPTKVRAGIRCVTDDSATTGYVVGDEVPIESSGGGAGAFNVAIFYNATLVGCTFQGSTVSVNHKTTGALTNIVTNAHWQIFIYAQL